MAMIRVRVPDEDLRLVKAFAETENVSVSEVVRTALDERIQKRCASRDFQERLRRARERNSEVLDLLAK